jgi:hypothetical protein
LGLAGPDVVRLDVALIERPLDDAYLSWDIWKLADEQAVPLERKSLLEDNGFRVGQIGGIKPAALQTLLTSERSCANPRRFFLHCGKSAPLSLGPTSTNWHCQLHLDGEAAPVMFPQAACLLQVVSSFGTEGELHLQFTPQIQDGKPILSGQPAADNQVLFTGRAADAILLKLELGSDASSQPIPDHQCARRSLGFAGLSLFPPAGRVRARAALAGDPSPRIGVANQGGFVSKISFISRFSARVK